jgi:hypothetical protein
MTERLTSGAMPEDWKPTPEPPEPATTRWVATGLPGGIRVDPHPREVPAGLYDLPPAPKGGDVQTALQYERAAYASGSPHVLRATACTGCGTALTYYGRAERIPAEPRCRKCEPPPTA